MAALKRKDVGGKSQRAGSGAHRKLTYHGLFHSSLTFRGKKGKNPKKEATTDERFHTTTRDGNKRPALVMRESMPHLPGT